MHMSRHCAYGIMLFIRNPALRLGGVLFLVFLCFYIFFSFSFFFFIIFLSFFLRDGCRTCFLYFIFFYFFLEYFFFFSFPDFSQQPLFSPPPLRRSSLSLGLGLGEELCRLLLLRSPVQGGVRGLSCAGEWLCLPPLGLALVV